MSEATSTTADGHLIFAFLLTAITIGIVTRYICTRLRLDVPYTSVLLIVMTCLGCVQLGGSELASAATAFSGIDPDLLQFIFLPVLVLEVALDVDIRNFLRLLPVILLLLIPGLTITALLTALLVHYGLPAYEWDWSEPHRCILSSTHLLISL